jgi:hypothetical protein
MSRWKESALCILDGEGKIVRETKLPTDPDVIARFVADTGLPIERIGLESGCTPPGCLPGCSGMAGPLSASTCGTRRRRCKPVSATRLIVATHAASPISCVNKYRPVWVKSPEAQRQSRLLTARATLQSQLVALENTIRGLLR